MVEYSREHWEQVMLTVLERVGAEKFLDHVAYALEQSGYVILAKHMQDLTALKVLMPEPDDARRWDWLKDD